MRDLERTRDTTTAPFECSQMTDIGTLKENLSLVGFGDPGEDIKHSRFAGAVWTNHAKGFPFVEMHAQIIVSHQRTEAFGDTTEFKNRAHSQLVGGSIPDRHKRTTGRRPRAISVQLSSLSLS